MSRLVRHKSHRIRISTKNAKSAGGVFCITQNRDRARKTLDTVKTADDTTETRRTAADTGYAVQHDPIGSRAKSVNNILEELNNEKTFQTLS